MAVGERIRVGLITFVIGLFSVVPAPLYAVDTTPTVPALVDGPFMITAYSFSGSQLNYLQIANTSSSVAALDGWKIQTTSGGVLWEFDELVGLVPPKNHVTVASAVVMDDATFLYTHSSSAAVTVIDTLRLVAPSGRGLLDHVLEPRVVASTPRDTSTAPPTFYYSRNISTSTGNYLSTFTASATQPATLASDPLYTPAATIAIQIVEIYPNAKSCSPATDGPLCYDYIKLFNSGVQAFDLGGLRIRTGEVGQSATASNTSYPVDVLAPGGYVAVKIGLTDSGSNIWLEDSFGLNPYLKTALTYPSASSYQGSAWSYNSASGGWQWTRYPTPINQPNKFGLTEKINSCSGLRLSEIGANYSPQFVEIHNPTSKTVDLSGCQIQTNRSAVDSFVFAAGTTLAPREHRAVTIEDTDLSLTKTTSGTVYLLSSDGASEVDARAYENLNEGTSYALVDGSWQQTFAVTPSGGNELQKYLACEVGYTRNDLTGRCNKVVVAAVLAPCGSGQYRNAETGRCRNLVSATSSLTPCDAGEYRNPETNRCRSLASAASSLKPCEPGYERNLDTNRCRKVLGASTTEATQAFAVEPIEDTGRAFVAWWALGGVILLGLAYAGWEWRHEIGQWARRITGRSKI